MFFALGQSNQVDGNGEGVDSTELTTSENDSEIILWEKSGTWNFTTGQPEVGSNDSGGWSSLDNWGGFGSGNAFVRKIFVDQGYSANGKKLALFKFAWNATGIDFRWSKTGSTPSPDSLADKLKLEWDQAVVELYALGYAIRPMGIIGSFGEGDSLTVTDATKKQSVKSSIVEFISDIRSDLALNGEILPLFWNQLSDYDTATYNPSRTFGWVAVRDIFWEVFENDPNAFLINSDEATRPDDDIHYDASGREYLGVEKAKAFQGQPFQTATR